jgi:ABC-type Fe3+/spermidine/putrescine transport system ATPase subunit
MTEPFALECRALAKMLGGKAVLPNLDFSVAPGEVVSLVGASGSGKTTLLRLVAGLAEPDRGEIRLMGETVWSAARRVPAEQRRIGLVFQDYALWPHMTVRDNLAFGLKARHLKRDDMARRVDHALEITQLGALRERRPAELSGGQQQRVAIARCLAARPRLLLLDEPLSNLDAALREDLRADMMRLIRAEGMTALYVTHDQSEAMAVSDRLAVMEQGTIVQLAPPQEIYEAPVSPFVAQFLGGFSLLSGRSDADGFVAGDGTRLRHGSAPLIGDAVLVVRPEDVAPPARHPDNRVRGRVAECAYQGRCWRLSVAVAGDMLRLDWPERRAIGTDLDFSLPPERCIVLAR